MNKATINNFTRAFGNAMLAAALLMSTSGHHVKIKEKLSLPVIEVRYCQVKDETPARQCALFLF